MVIKSIYSKKVVEKQLYKVTEISFGSCKKIAKLMGKKLDYSKEDKKTKIVEVQRLLASTHKTN